MFKNSGDLVIDSFVKCLNTLFDNRIFAENWTETIIFPLFKKGAVNDPGNNGGISLCDTSSKMYSSTINCRLQEWVEQNNNIPGNMKLSSKEVIVLSIKCLRC